MTEIIVPKKATPIITMVTHGRRALGENWVTVEIGHRDDEVYVESTPTDAPDDGKPVIIPGVEDRHYIADILEAQRGKAAERKIAQANEMTYEEKFELVNEMWFNYIEEKLRFLKGQTSIGVAGMFQRQRVHQNPDTRPAHH